MYDKQIDVIEQVQRDRAKLVDNRKIGLVSKIGKIKEATNEASHVRKSKSDFVITHQYSSMFKTLSELSEIKPDKVDSLLNFLRYETTVPMDVPSPGFLIQREQWKLIAKFHTKEVKDPMAVALNQSGDINASYETGIKGRGGGFLVQRSIRGRAAEMGLRISLLV